MSQSAAILSLFIQQICAEHFVSINLLISHNNPVMYVPLSSVMKLCNKCNKLLY